MTSTGSTCDDVCLDGAVPFWRNDSPHPWRDRHRPGVRARGHRSEPGETGGAAADRGSGGGLVPDAVALPAGGRPGRARGRARATLGSRRGPTRPARGGDRFCDINGTKGSGCSDTESGQQLAATIEQHINRCLDAPPPRVGPVSDQTLSVWTALTPDPTSPINPATRVGDPR